jgi:Ni/Fe-hydrogenase subunit HybB-like protein
VSSATVPAARAMDPITEAAVRPIRSAGLRFWILAAALGAVVAVGVGAWLYQVMHGIGVSGLNDRVFWGIYTSNLVTFIGVSYGGAVTSAVLRLANAPWRAPITRMAEAMALVTLAIGALFAVIHLGRPDRLWEFLSSPNPHSPLVWDVTAITTYLVATFVFLALPLIPDAARCRDALAGETSAWRMRIYRAVALGWRDLPVQRRVVRQGMTVMAIAIIPLAVSVHSVLAWAFGVTVRPGWHSTIEAPYFVIAALLSGVAMVILVIAAFRWAYHLEDFVTSKQFRYLGYLMLALGITYLYMTISEMLTDSYVLDAQSAPLLESLLVGKFSVLFWLFLIGGGLVPTVLVVLPWTRNVRGITVAAALAVGGMWLKRIIIVVPPLFDSYYGGSASAAYRPSVVEILITLAATAAIPLLLMLFFRVFPVLPIDEMHEIAEQEAERESQVVAALRLRLAIDEGGAR